MSKKNELKKKTEKKTSKTKIKKKRNKEKTPLEIKAWLVRPGVFIATFPHNEKLVKKYATWSHIDSINFFIAQKQTKPKHSRLVTEL